LAISAARIAAARHESIDLTMTDTGMNPPGNPIQAGNNLEPRRHSARPAGGGGCAAEFDRLRSGTLEPVMN